MKYNDDIRNGQTGECKREGKDPQKATSIYLNIYHDFISANDALAI